jgi:hypothetical protein
LQPGHKGVGEDRRTRSSSSYFIKYFSPPQMLCDWRHLRGHKLPAALPDVM